MSKRTGGREKMLSKTFFPMGLVGLLILGGCAGKSAPASTPADSGTSQETLQEGAQGTISLNELTSIDVKENDGALSIQINGTQPMSPNIFRLTYFT